MFEIFFIEKDSSVADRSKPISISVNISDLDS